MIRDAGIPRRRLASSRLFGTLGGNAFGFAASVASQFLITPILIEYWGSESYGKWLYYYTLPTFASFYGASLVAVGENQAVLLWTSGREAEARESLAKSGLLSFGILTCFAVALSIAVVSGVVGRDYDSDLYPPLLLASVLGFSSYLAQPFYRVSNRLGLCLVHFNTQRLLEAAGIAAVSISGGGLGAAALAVVAMRMTFLLAVFTYAFKNFRRAIPHLSDLWGTAVSYSQLLYLSLHSLANTLSNLLRQTLPAFLIFSYIGGTALAQYNAARLLGRLPGFGFLILNNSVKSELSHIEKQDLENTGLRLVRLSLVAIGGIGVVSILAAYFLGPRAASLWLRNNLPIPKSLIVLSVTQAVTESISIAMVGPFIAHNRHRNVSWAMLAFTSLALAASFAGIAIFQTKWLVFAAISVADLLIACFAAFQIRNLFQE